MRWRLPKSQTSSPAMMADAEHGVYLPATCAPALKWSSRSATLCRWLCQPARLAAGNTALPPGEPFFPAAYYRYRRRRPFALALEAAGLSAVGAFEGARSRWKSGVRRSSGKSKITPANWPLRRRAAQFRFNDGALGGLSSPTRALQPVVAPAGVRRSSGWAPNVGTCTVRWPAASGLTDALGRADFHRTGFGGLMLPMTGRCHPRRPRRRNAFGSSETC